MWIAYVVGCVLLCYLAQFLLKRMRAPQHLLWIVWFILALIAASLILPHSAPAPLALEKYEF